MLSAAQAHLPPELRRLVFEYADDTLATFINAADDYTYHQLLVHAHCKLEDELQKWSDAEDDAWRAYTRLHPDRYCHAVCAYQSTLHGRREGCEKPTCPRDFCCCDCRVCGEIRFVHKPS